MSATWNRGEWDAERCGATVDDALERHVGVTHRAGTAPVGADDQIAHRVGGSQAGAQHHRVDEHADEVGDGRVVASRHGGSDADVVGGREPPERERQRGLEDRERGDGQRCGEPADSRGELGVQVGVEIVSRPGDHARPGSIGGQMQQVRRAVELVPPELQPLDEHRRGLLRGAQGLRPFDRDVGVLQRKRSEPGLVSGPSAVVGRHQVVQQRAQRVAVRRDVVQDEHDTSPPGSPVRSR